LTSCDLLTNPSLKSLKHIALKVHHIPPSDIYLLTKVPMRFLVTIHHQFLTMRLNSSLVPKPWNLYRLHYIRAFCWISPNNIAWNTVTRGVYYITVAHFLVGENTALKEGICGDVLGHHVLEVLRGHIIESFLTTWYLVKMFNWNKSPILL
jgi:hypothetical protein